MLALVTTAHFEIFSKASEKDDIQVLQASEKDPSVKMNADLPTFASMARARGSSQLRRPSYLNLQTKDNIKRIDVLELLKSIAVPQQN